MSEASTFTHYFPRSLTLCVVLCALGFFAFHSIGPVHAADTGNKRSRFDGKLETLRTTMLGHYAGILDGTLFSAEGTSSIVDPVPVSLPDMVTLEDSEFLIPVTVGDLTGEGVRSFEFDLLYDHTVIVPHASPIETAGTISEGMGVSINDTVPGVLRVVFFTSTHRTGSGTLFNFRFTAVGEDSDISPLTWQGFMFNEGDPGSSTTNGSVTLVANRTITVTQTANGTIAPGTTVVPYGGNQVFTIMPDPNYHVVDVLVDGNSVGPVTEYIFNNVTANHTLTATFAINTYPITATSGANGAVTPAGITNVPHGGSQEYTITPAANYLIEDVLVDGVSVGPIQLYTFESVTEPHTISATFVIKKFALTVATVGNGTVTSDPTGIDCGADCSEIYDVATTVTLTATPDTGWDFTGWTGGGCTGTGTCEITIAEATSVTATFALKTFALNVNRIGTGIGQITSDPAGIVCGGDCTETYDFGTEVTLTAAPDISSVFTGWSGGGCLGTDACVVTMDAAKTVTATFTKKTFVLEVLKPGNGNGTVTSVPAGIDCGADCQQVYDYGTEVTLTAVAAPDSNFTGWNGGGCSGTGTCVVNMTEAAAVTATFTLKQFTLTVAKSGTGNGTVTSAPLGIDCGTDCAEPFNINTVVTLSAVAAAGATFDGWSGAGCSGTGTCVVTMTAAATVTAAFTRQVATLTVAKTGNGFGTISSSPAGISCGTDCAEDYPIGAQVTLTAAPSLGSNFMGWTGGGCSGTGTCVVTVNTATTVTAEFVLQRHTLNVVRAGTGAANGTVVSTPAGINCGTDCDEIYNSGQAIALEASALPGTDFVGWSGAGCTGTSTCVVTMIGATTVTATFTIKTFGLAVTKNGNGTGVVTSDPAGIICGADCSETYNIGTLVTLTPTPDPGSNFTSWSGACTGSGACTVTMNQLTMVNATFTLQIHSLQVVKTGNGTGLVTSSPAGINCGADCSEPYNYDSVVTLTAAANTDSNFMGWNGGGCSGTGTCVVTITAATSVTAAFDLKTFTLNVNKNGNGTGTVTSSPTGIDCGGDCTEIYNIGTVVTLTAAAGSGSSFGGWNGAGCSGGGTCVVTMNAVASVTATFNAFPTVQFSSATYTGNESRTAVVTVTRTGDLSIASSVTLSTSPGTGAVASDSCGPNVDYIDLAQSVNFAPSEAVRSVEVTLCPDLIIDPAETINALLSAPVSALTGPQNTSLITINDTANQFQGGLNGIFLFSNTNAEPYPSAIDVSGTPSGLLRIRVTLYDLWHPEPDNFYAMLVSPTGSKYVLMGAAGGNLPVSSSAPVTLTFGDFESNVLPDEGLLTTGAFRPTTCQTPILDFPFPAPPGPYDEPGCVVPSNRSLTGVFSGASANGTWSLYLIDAGTGVPFTLAGMVAGGWGIELVPTAHVEVSGQVLTPSLVGLRNAVVSLTDPQGVRRTVSTSSLGFFTFDNVPSGGTYLMSVASRRYRFESRVLQVENSIQNLQFIGLE